MSLRRAQNLVDAVAIVFGVVMIAAGIGFFA
jgi:hypothetical protein